MTEPLPMDIELDHLMEPSERLYASGAAPLSRQSIIDRVTNDPRMLVALGRKVQRLQIEMDSIIEMAKYQIDEHNARIKRIETATEDELAPLGRQLEQVAGIIESIVRMRRDEGLGNQLTIPSVGTWNAKLQPGGWRVPDGEKVAKVLAGDDKARFVDPVPQDPKLKLKGDEFKKHLEEMAETAVAELVQSPGFMDLPQDDRERRILDVRAEIARQYPGVEYKPDVVEIKYDLA